MPSDQDMPKWDVALSALADEEFRKKGSPLTMSDFRRLAKQYAIRLDDIMETMFLLAVNKAWVYTDATGREQVLDQGTLDSFYAKQRLTEEELNSFDGLWQPAGGN